MFIRTVTVVIETALKKSYLNVILTLVSIKKLGIPLHASRAKSVLVFNSAIAKPNQEKCTE